MEFLEFSYGFWCATPGFSVAPCALPYEKENPWRLHWIRVVVNVADLTHTAFIPLISIQTADIELC